MSRGLQQAQGAIDGEVTASRAAWPTVARGLPAHVSPRARALITAAREAARQARTRHFVAQARELTGPAAGIAGLLHAFEGLTERGWTLTLNAIDGIEAPNGTPAAMRYLRGGASLYIGSIYDGHYALSVVGEKLGRAYEALGSAAAFGSALPASTVRALTRAFSPAADRLAPEPPKEQ